MVAQEGGSKLDTRKQESLRSLFDDLPNGFEARYATLRNLRESFHEALGAIFTPMLNDHLARNPVDRIQDRRKLATWVDRVTRDLGLTVVASQETNRPALLVAEQLHPREPGSGGYALLVRERRGGYSLAHVSQDMPHPLRLAPAPSNIESMFEPYRAPGAQGRRR